MVKLWLCLASVLAMAASKPFPPQFQNQRLRSLRAHADPAPSPVAEPTAPTPVIDPSEPPMAPVVEVPGVTPTDTPTEFPTAESDIDCPPDAPTDTPPVMEPVPTPVDTPVDPVVPVTSPTATPVDVVPTPVVVETPTGVEPTPVVPMAAPTDLPVAVPVVAPVADTPTEEPVVDTPTDLPVAAPVVDPVVPVDTPTDMPVDPEVPVVDTPTESPVAAPVDPVVPVDTPTEEPVDPVVDTPTDAPVDTVVVVPVDTPTEMPVDPVVPVDTPTESPVAAPVVDPVVPVDTPTDMPVDPEVPVGDAPTDSPVATPVDTIVVVPVAVPTDIPVDPVVPVDTPTDMPVDRDVPVVDTPTDSPVEAPVAPVATPTDTPVDIVVPVDTPTETPVAAPVVDPVVPGDTPTESPVATPAVDPVVPVDTPTDMPVDPVVPIDTPTESPVTTPVVPADTPTEMPVVVDAPTDPPVDREIEIPTVSPVDIDPVPTVPLDVPTDSPVIGIPVTSPTESPTESPVVAVVPTIIPPIDLAPTPVVPVDTPTPPVDVEPTPVVPIDTPTESPVVSPSREITAPPLMAPTEAPVPGISIVPVPVQVTIPTSSPAGVPSIAPIDDPTVTPPPVEITFPQVISLGSIQPGGITAQGDSFYVANQLFGGIRTIDAGTGEIGVLSPNTVFLQRVMFGLDSNANTVYAAGLELVEEEYEGRIFVFNSETGEELAVCGAPDFYPTDVALQGDSVYANNAVGSNLVRLDAVAAAEGECLVDLVPLPADEFSEELPTDQVQGIDGYNSGLIFSSKTSANREIFYYDLEEETLTGIGEGPSGGGGLVVDGDTLYAADTAMDRVQVFDLVSVDGVVSSSFSGTLASDSVGSPTFMDVGSNGNLYVLNTVDDFALVSLDPEDIDSAPVTPGVVTLSPTGSPVIPVDIPMFETIDAASTTVSLGPAHPGGIALGSGVLRNQLFVSNLFFGGIRIIDLTTGESRVLQGNRLYLERTAFGMDYDEGNELLFVAGSETMAGGVNSGLLYAYDPFTGQEALMCRMPDYYPTDVAVVGSQVYSTNTLTNTLVVAASPASGDCELDQIQLPDGFAATEFDASVVQGITPYADGLILVSLGDGLLYYYDPATGSYTDIGPGPTRGGGLHVEGNNLFVADTANDRVLVYELAGSTGGTVTATAVGALQSEFLEGPTFPGVFNGNLYTSNSLFSTDEVTEDYSLVVQNVVSILPFQFPTEVSLQGFQPGGIEVGAGFFQDQLFVSNLLFGGVLVVDVITGDRRVLLGNLLSTGRTAFGLACDKESNFLFVAGSESGQGAIFVINIMTGGQVATCDAPNFYPTDVTIVGNSAYATNSLESNLIVLDVAAAAEGRCEVELLNLPAELSPPEEFDPATLYSLTSYNGGLIMASTEPNVPSTIFYLDVATGSTTELVTGPVGGIGGVEVNRDQLIVSDAGANSLEVYNLEVDGDIIAASPSSTITSDEFAGPLASTVYKDSVVYSINSQPINGAYLIVATDL